MRYSVTGTVLRAGITAVSFVISQIGAGAPSDGAGGAVSAPNESYTTWLMPFAPH